MALNKVARAWVRALRSGKYKQTKEVLTRLNAKSATPKSHCCLGVLCELAIKSGISLEIGEDRFGRERVYDGKTSLLPESVRTWAGLTTNDGTFGKDSTRTDLTVKNDNGHSFKKIADLIVKHQKQLFEVTRRKTKARRGS